MKGPILVAVAAFGVLNLAYAGEEEYDFVIVGGGLAGSVLANRLSASGRHSVLVLNIAGAPPKAYGGPVVISDEFIINKNITANDGLRANILQPGYEPVKRFSTDMTGSSPARMLGGSSLVALSLYLRDHPEAIDAWGEGWSWTELRKYFHRAEGLEGTKVALAESDYGQEGPYKIQQHPAYVHSLTREFVQAARSEGVPWAPDLNTERGVGVGLTPTTQRSDGGKVHAYDAYLQPALGRSNLKVLHGARADRLVVQDGRCRGVAYRVLTDSSDHVVRARREVLVAGGYIYSPRLLFLSGIGAKKDLDALGLHVVEDLPAVGRNLTAARYSPLAFHTESPTLARMMGKPISMAGTKPEPAAYGSAVVEATARVRSRHATQVNPNSQKPDIVLSFMPLFYAPKSAPLQYSLQGEKWPLQTNAFTILATLGETKAQGSVTFTSGSPDVSPVVTHEPMTDLEDLARAKEAAEWATRIGNSGSFSKPGRPVENGAGGPGMWTAVYDGRGTCRMGEDRRTSVVDHKLRVHGIEGLRVVDGSVIPVGSPYLAVPEVLALAERASELILDAHSEAHLTLEFASKEQESKGRVSIDSISKVLGERFAIMEAVSYLAGTESEGLLAKPMERSLNGVVLVAAAVAISVITMSAVLCSRAKQTEQGKYALLG